MIVQFESAVQFVAPPYLWQTHSIGLLALSGFIGTILAVFIGGKMIDMIANSMTARNGGHRKPEYRLIALFIPAIIGPVGLLIFGITLQAKAPWIAPAVGYCMQGFALTACSNIIATYAVDSCPGVRIISSNTFMTPNHSHFCLLFPTFGFD
jgi:MFS family permease